MIRRFLTGLIIIVLLALIVYQIHYLLIHTYDNYQHNIQREDSKKTFRNVVWLQPDGKSEQVYTTDNKLVKDNINRAKNNKYHSLHNPFRHLFFDTLPWILYGVGEDENLKLKSNSLRRKRLIAYFKDLGNGLGRKVKQNFLLHKDIIDAINKGDAVQLSFLLDNNSYNLNPPPMDGLSNQPLHLAATKGELRCANILIDHGADVNLLDQNFETPLLKTAQRKDYEMFILFLDNEANLNIPNDYGITTFIGICGMGDTRMATLSVKYGADIDNSYFIKNVKSSYLKNLNPIHYAVKHNQLEIIEILLMAGCNPKILNEDNETPLEVAKKKGVVGGNILEIRVKSIFFLTTSYLLILLLLRGVAQMTSFFYCDRFLTR